LSPKNTTEIRNNPRGDFQLKRGEEKLGKYKETKEAVLDSKTS